MFSKNATLQNKTKIVKWQKIAKSYIWLFLYVFQYNYFFFKKLIFACIYTNDLHIVLRYNSVCLQMLHTDQSDRQKNKRKLSFIPFLPLPPSGETCWWRRAWGLRTWLWWGWRTSTLASRGTRCTDLALCPICTAAFACVSSSRWWRRRRRRAGRLRTRTGWGCMSTRGASACPGRRAGRRRAPPSTTTAARRTQTHRRQRPRTQAPKPKPCGRQSGRHWTDVLKMVERISLGSKIYALRETYLIKNKHPYGYTHQKSNYYDH